MNIVIPMAGKGQRFFDAGYRIPKYLIKVKGKSILEWSLDSLPLQIASKIIFVILQEHEDNYKISEYIKKKYNQLLNIEFVFLNNITKGQSETVINAKKNIDKNKKLLIYNIDTKFNSTTLKNNLKKKCDGLVGTFYSQEKRFSYAKTIGTRVIETAEKKVISVNALTGLYMFSDPFSFFETAEKHIALNKKINNEYYIAPLYNDLIQNNKLIIIDKVNQINILGTPEEVKKFESN